MQKADELFQKILDQPEPILLSKLTPYCSEFTINSFSQYCKHFRNIRTANEYTYIFADFFNYLKKDLLQVSSEDVKRYFSSIGPKYSTRSLRTRISAMRAFARFLDNEYLSSENEYDPESSMQTTDYSIVSDGPEFTQLFPEFSFEKEPPLVVGITLQDIDLVLSTLMDEQNLTLFAIIALVLRTGMTTDEICNLTIHQLISKSKNECGIMILGVRNRFIKVPTDVFALLLLLSEQTANEAGYLFLTDRKHHPYSQRNLLYEIKSACSRAAIRPFTLQQLRNFAILLMLKNNAPDQLVENYVSTDSRWTPKYKEAAQALKIAPCDYVCLPLCQNNLKGMET